MSRGHAYTRQCRHSHAAHAVVFTGSEPWRRTERMSSEEGTLSITAPPRALPRRRPAQAASLAAALALALTACGGGDPAPTETTTTAPALSTQAADTPTPTATATAGASPSTPDGGTAPSSGSGSGPASATASGPYVPASAEGPAQNVPKPVMPEVMKEETQEGAEAAVKYFWETVYYAEQTGDTAPIDSLSSEYCEFCELSASNLSSIYRNGGWYTGTKAKVSSSILRPSSTGYTATILVDTPKGTGFDKEGQVAPGGVVPAQNDQPWITELFFDDTEEYWIVDEMTYKGTGATP